MLMREFFSYYRGNMKLFVLDFGSALVVGLIDLAFPVAIKIFIDNLLPTQNWWLIAWVGFFLALLYAANSCLTYVVNYWGHMLGINIETEMRRKSFEHLQKLSFTFFDSNKTGSIVARLTKDLEEIGELAHHGPEDLFIAVMTILGSVLIMFTLNAHLALLTVIVVPPIVYVTTRYAVALERNWQSIFNKVADFNNRIEDVVGGMRVVQAFTNEDLEKSRFHNDNILYRTTKLRGYRFLASSASIFYFGSRGVQIVAMVAASYFVINGSMTSGDFVAFLLLVGVFVRPIEKIGSVLESFTKGIAGFRRHLAFLSAEPEVRERLGAEDLEIVRGDIKYNDVGFAYQGRGHQIEGLTLDIAAGETVAFVGSSGAGKTTICSLLPRFYDVSSGSITIDDVDIRDVTLRSLRSSIGIVQQDTFLFGGTIGENIRYGKNDASPHDVMVAACRAKIDDLIESLPEGLNTVIGERGVKLSGGQRQRISIARMFLKDPPILILDEATSSLDSATEAEIQESIVALAKGRTTLIVAHRLGTIRRADRIVVVDQGRVLEIGSHNELLSSGGLYRSLYQAQLIGFENAS
jgi:ATP-binding cassette subfamily B protein